MPSKHRTLAIPISPSHAQAFAMAIGATNLSEGYVDAEASRP